MPTKGSDKIKGDENVKEIKKRINIEGEKVRNVGYRPFLLAKALRLRIPKFDAENIEDNGIRKVVVSIIGEEGQISEFEKFVNENIPKNAKVSKASIEEGISDVMPIEEYRKLLNSEQLNNIIQGGIELRDDTNLFRTETDTNFKSMDEKYDAISQGMFAVVSRLEKRDEAFEKRLEKRDEAFERRIEKTDKNIEELLQILAKKKS